MDDDLSSSMKWQLLDKPVDGKSFSRGIKKGLFSKEKGVMFLSHPEAVISFDKEETIQFCSREEPLANVMYEFKGSDGTNYQQCVCLERDGLLNIVCRIRPLHRGKYRLKLFGSFQSTTKLESLTEYVIKCNSVYIPARLFPGFDALWGPLHGYQDFGFHDKFIEQQHFTTVDGHITINVKTTKRVFTISKLEDYHGNILENNVFMSCDTKQLHIRVQLTYQGEFKLTLLASRNSSDSKYHSVAHLRLTCLSKRDSNTLFPNRETLWGPVANYREYGFEDSVLEQAEFEMENGEVDICLQTHKRVNALAELKFANSSEKMAGCICMVTTSALLSLKIRVPRKGNYELTVFVKHKSHNYDFVIALMLSCMEPNGQFEPFVDHSMSWGPVHNYKKFGIGEAVLGQGCLETFTGEIELQIPSRTNRMPYKLMAKLCHSLYSAELNTFVILQTDTPSSMTCSVRLPQTGMYKLTIFVECTAESYLPAIYYMINCRETNNNCLQFPILYSPAIDRNAYLIEPLNLEIPANSQVRFRFRAPGFDYVLIANDRYERKKDCTWDFVTTTPDSRNELNIFGRIQKSRSTESLFGYHVV